MKKLFAGVAAAALALSMSTTAFATSSNFADDDEYGDASTVHAEIEGSGVVQSIPVNVDVTGFGGETATVYGIDITWEDFDFQFEFTNGTPAVWNPTTHEYEGSTKNLAGKWTDESSKEGTITITNHSNAKIDVTAEFKTEADIALELDPEELKLASAEGIPAEVEEEPYLDGDNTGVITLSTTKVTTANMPPNVTNPELLVGTVELTLKKGA